MSYEFRGMVVPQNIIESITRYVERGIQPGGFIEAVIRNDLKDACGRADEDNLRIISAIVAYFYNEVPGDCWGSPEKFDAWMDRHAEDRRMVEEMEL